MKNKFKIQLVTVTRYFFYTLLITLSLSSCNGGFNPNACLSSVKEMFPDADVYAPLGGSINTFVVIDSTNVYMVKTMSLTSPDVTDVIILQKK